MSLDLFQLLPAVYRLRDAQIAAASTLLSAAEQAELAALEASVTPLTADQKAQIALLTAKAARGPLESLLRVIEEQIAAFGDDLDQLYDDQFIETCAQWVIPYIGDLIGYQAVHGITPQVDNPRAEVASTISLRRRKGTVLVMEQLARDLTGWGAHAIECFEVLADAQYMKHIRPANWHTPNVRRWQTGFYVNTGFDRTAHAVDVHRIVTGRGRYNIQNIAIFLWALGAYSVTNVPATAATNTPGALACFRFSPLGMDMPLFHRAQSQGEPIETAATPVNVADRLRRRALCEDIQRGVGSAWYGPGQSLVLVRDGKVLNPYQVRVADLSGPDGSWANAAAAGAADAQYAALVDPELGRILLPAAPGNPPPAQAPQLALTYCRGFNADMGGGEYARGQNFTVTDPAFIFPYPDTAVPPRYANLQQAFTFAATQFGETGALAFEIAGSAPHDIGGPLALDLPAGTTLELRAADGAAPTLFLDGELSVSGDADSTFILDGFVVCATSSMVPAKAPATSPAAFVHVPAARPSGAPNLLGALTLRHCTLVPGWSVATDGTPRYADAPTVIVAAPGTALTAQRAIVGPIRAVPRATVELCDCIVDATDRTHIAYAAPDSATGAAAPETGGGALTLLGCTVIGKVHAELLALVSESILWAALASGDTWAAGLVADRKQAGCVRFSFLPYHALTPRRFKCVEAALAAPKPLFLALRYGQPAYAKLAASTDDSIRRGAEDGGEMGAFHFILAPLRETDLESRMQEYLPVGLEFGLIYQT